MNDRHPDCSREFTLLLLGGVRTTWSCGATRLDPNEEAVDVEILAERSPHHHHHHHLPHPTRRHQ